MITYTFRKGGGETKNLLTDFHVAVERSTGLIGKPGLKSVDSFDWKYLHGTTPDLRNRRYRSREITLSCWLEADSKQQLVSRYDSLMSYFNHDGLIMMKVSWETDKNEDMIPNPHSAKGLFFLVYLDKIDGVRFGWRYGKNRVRFDMPLIDPYPMKRLLQLRGTAGQGVDYDIVSETEIDIVTEDGASVCDILTGTGHIACGLNRHIMVCGDVVHATNSSGGATLVTPTDVKEDYVDTIYEEI